MRGHEGVQEKKGGFVMGAAGQAISEAKERMVVRN